MKGFLNKKLKLSKKSARRYLENQFNKRLMEGTSKYLWTMGNGLPYAIVKYNKK